MKKQARRMLTLLLALTLILGLLPAAAGAADPAPLSLTAADCVEIGEYMSAPAYLYEGEIPEGTLEVTFADFAADGTTITSMTATNTMLQDVNTAPFSDLFIYTAADAADDDSLELNGNYADYPFENVFAYFVMDEGGEWCSYFIVYDMPETPVEYDRSFTVTVGNDVISWEDAELVEDGYAYKDMTGTSYAGTVDLYVVTVPWGTESVLLTFAENRLAYNYTGDDEYLGGYYSDFQVGAPTAEVPLDYGNDNVPADGVIDFIRVQTPYDASWYSELLYAVTFRVAPPVIPVITKQPVDYVGKAGSTARFEVEAVGEGDLTYQWYVKAPGDNEFTLSSVQRSFYSTKLTAGNSGRALYCVVSNAGGSVQSATVTMTIPDPPVITVQPKPYTGAAGSRARFTVTAEGEGLTYQWYVKNPGDEAFSPSSVKQAAYSAALTEANSGRELYCVVSNAGGSVQSATVTMTIPDPPVITVQPKPYTGAAGSRARFTVTAEGEGLTYQWYVKNPGEDTFKKSSVKQAVYSATLTEANSGRELYCVVSNGGGSVQTDIVTMTVK